MKIVYIADDGTKFDDQFDCKDYEWRLNHPHLRDVCCYDKDGNKLENILSEDIYHYSEKLVVYSDDAAKDLQELGDYTGYYSYRDITEKGIWVYKKHDYNNENGFELLSKEV